MSTHAILSPSSASRWLYCPASVSLTRGVEDESSEFADEGTAAHELAAMALTAGVDANAYLGRVIQVGERSFEVDDEMVGYVQTYIDIVRAIPGELMVEQRLPITPITGEPDAFGTADAVILSGDEIVIVDLKYGCGVKVEAEGNDQLAIYALAALLEYEFLGDFKRVRLIIVQPRLSHVPEWSIPIEGEGRTLMNFAKHVEPRCIRAMEIVRGAEITDADYAPSEKSCRWCKAKATCTALTEHVLTTVADDFVDVTEPIAPQLASAEERIANSDNKHVAACLAAVGLIESWCKAVRAKAEAELFAGRAVPGFKLVEGRRGPRRWSDDSEVETLLKSMRLKHEQIYDYSLISPTTAEKLHKSGDIGPRQWPRLQELITQSDGKPSVAPESDKRPALVMTAVADEFENVEE